MRLDFIKDGIMNNLNSKRQKSSEAEEYFDIYWRYCSSLRNWFVAFGIGGCILFVSDKAKMFQDVSKPIKILIVGSFIAGVALQILLSLINKWTHWYVYHGKEEEEKRGKKDFQETRRYKFAYRLSNFFGIDVFVDLFTIIAFAIATTLVFITLFSD